MAQKPNRCLVFAVLYSALIAGGLLHASFSKADYSNNPLNIDIINTPIEDLLQVKVISASKVEESIKGTASAIYVLTQEKIRRSGATSIPEALRLVPGVQVSRIDANKWAVSIRGFNARTSNKLLVLVDGRNIADPIFSGTLWETKDIMLDDIERIEVIRGPGGTLWGSNAVNGVINIITKHAKDTQGTLVAAGGGTEERGFGRARYGTALGEDQFFRVYSKYQNRGTGWRPGGADDDSQLGQSGFRYDTQIDERTSADFQGNYYVGQQGSPDSQVLRDQDASGGNLLFRWQRQYTPESILSVLSYVDHTEFDSPLIGQVRDTYAFEVQQGFLPSDSHRLMTGLTYRGSKDSIRNSDFLTILPDERTNNVVSAYLEDRYEVIEKTLYVSVGSKISHSQFSGGEFQPSGSVSWIIDDKNTLWSSVSKAARAPSRLERDLRVSVPGVGVIEGGNPGSEYVAAYELGYRTALMENVALDTTAFVNNYDNLVSLEALEFMNRAHGQTYGAEATVGWQVSPSWRLEGSYTALQMDLKLDPGSIADPATIQAIEGSSPQNQFSIQSLLNLSKRFSLDADIRYVDSLKALGAGSYIVGDIRLAYLLSDHLELSLVGQNLFENHHFEQSRRDGTGVEQGGYAQLRWQY